MDDIDMLCNQFEFNTLNDEYSNEMVSAFNVDNKDISIVSCDLSYDFLIIYKNGIISELKQTYDIFYVISFNYKEQHIQVYDSKYFDQESVYMIIEHFINEYIATDFVIFKCNYTYEALQIYNNIIPNIEDYGINGFNIVNVKLKKKNLRFKFMLIF